MKIASLCLAFNVDETILQMISNLGPLVDKIYIAYSKYPWNYNKEAKEKFINNTNKETIMSSVYSEKICLISGNWESEEDQRNSCLEAAKADGMDFILVNDADEFILAEDFFRIKSVLLKHPQIDLFRVEWVQFWKSTNWVLTDKNGSIATGSPEYIINLKRDIKFIDRRKVNAETEYKIPVKLFHLGYVMSDTQMYIKINTWGHSHELFSKKWFDHKWLKWNSNVRYLHPVRPFYWCKALEYDGPLPVELLHWRDLKDPYIESNPEAIIRFFRDNLTMSMYRLRKYRRSLNRVLNRFFERKEVNCIEY